MEDKDLDRLAQKVGVFLNELPDHGTPAEVGLILVGSLVKMMEVFGVNALNKDLNELGQMFMALYRVECDAGKHKAVTVN